MYICIVIRKHKFNFKKQKMDEILENQIRFKEQILKEYIRLSKGSSANRRKFERTIDKLLDELQKLYRQRKLTTLTTDLFTCYSGEVTKNI